MLNVRRIEARQGQILRDVRCQALSDAPSAFSTTLEQALRRTEADWDDMAKNFSCALDAALFLAWHDEKPCGLMGCLSQPDHPEILDLMQVWVSPEHRRMKVGHALLSATSTWGAQHGAQEIHAWVTEQNEDALAFYRSMAFAATDQTQPLRPGATEQIRLFTFRLHS